LDIGVWECAGEARVVLETYHVFFDFIVISADEPVVPHAVVVQDTNS